MHLVFLNQYYPPDAAPTGVVLADLVEGMVAAGHEVTVLCAAGGYAGGGRVVGGRLSVVRLREASPGQVGDCGGELKHSAQAPLQRTTDNGQLTTPQSPRIIRIGATRFGRGTMVGKLVDYASYYLGVAWQLLWLRPRPERVVAMTTPPYLSVLARVMSKVRGADHAHWVMDLYPDVMVAHGMLREGSLIERVLSALARWGIGGKRCAAVVTLGPDMAQRVGGRRVIGCRLSVVRLREASPGQVRLREASPGQVGDCGEELKHGAQATLARTTDLSRRSIAKPDNGQRTTGSVTWVPLWGSGGRVVNAERALASHDPGEALTGMAEGNCRLSVVRLREASPGQVRLREASPGQVRLREASPGQVGDCGDEPGRSAQAPLRRTTDLSRRSIAKPDNGQRTTLPLPRTTSSTALRHARGWGDDDLVVMYSGNMGLGHRFGEILEVCGRVGGDCGRVVNAERALASHDPGEALTGMAEGNCQLSVVSDCEASPGQVSDCDGELKRGAQAPLRRTTDNGQPTTLNKSRFVFYGGGKRRAEVEEFVRTHPEGGVEVHDYAPAEELTAHLQSADVHLASLDAAWTGTMVPSKLQGIFAVGRPVIFIGSAESSIGQWISESGGGWVVAPGDVTGLLGALNEARDPAVRAARGQAAQEFARRHFDKAANVKRLVEVLAFASHAPDALGR